LVQRVPLPRYGLQPGLRFVLGLGARVEDTGFALNYANGSYAAGTETGTTNVDNIKTSLYLDVDGDGLLNISIDLLITTNEDADPAFTFPTCLVGGGIKYLVAVDTADTDLTTAGPDPDQHHVRRVTITTANITDVNFGFAPAWCWIRD